MEFNLCKSSQELALNLNTSSSTISGQLQKIREQAGHLGSFQEENGRLCIHSDKSSFKAEKLPFFPWISFKVAPKMNLLWQCSMQKDNELTRMNPHNLLILSPAAICWGKSNKTPIKRRNVLLHDNARPNSARILQENILDLGRSVEPHSSIYQALSDFHLFCSLQNVLNDIKFSQDQVKMRVEKIWSLKTVQFYSRRINKLLDKSQQLIQNNSKYTLLIEIHSLFIYSWINHIFQKQKLLLTQPYLSIDTPTY